jgi:hypothetical protein
LRTQLVWVLWISESEDGVSNLEFGDLWSEFDYLADNIDCEWGRKRFLDEETHGLAVAIMWIDAGNGDLDKDFILVGLWDGALDDHCGLADLL